jgi:D-tagatose-1,6-bisphosphate aldolase subunit GatZ/KbaZ
VIRAAIRRAKKYDTHVLIEATANQVNQNGGYTGMRPGNFIDFVFTIAEQEKLDQRNVILGGDHLGPLTFCNFNEAEAMGMAADLIRSYVLSGFTKIHIDTSMHVKDDDRKKALPVEVCAKRAAELCSVCENAFSELKAVNSRAVVPVYVLGSEVPVPGGATEDEDAVSVTSVAAVKNQIDVFRSEFARHGLEDAFERVIGFVVQPGVEFSNNHVFGYNPEKTAELVSVLHDEAIVFEAHSTDYQTRKQLRDLVSDGFAVLKVGPALTFALREALFALESIEKELHSVNKFSELSGFRSVLMRIMKTDDSQWKHHYHGSEAEKQFLCAFGLSDRARYYLPNNEVVSAINRLHHNINSLVVPYSLLSQYLPMQYSRVRDGTLDCSAESLICDHIGDYIDDYLFACGFQVD